MDEMVQSLCSSNSCLDSIDDRYKCEKCHSSRKYFCYCCLLPRPSIKDKLPSVRLPIKINIIQHAAERDGKSTAPHCALLSAAEFVRYYKYPGDFPTNLFNPYNAVLLWPSNDATLIQDWPKIIGSREYSKVIVVDGTWFYAKRMIRDPRLNGLSKIKLDSSYQTQYWRPQHGLSPDNLATIEAIYYFCVDYHRFILGKPYHGEYDELMFFFDYFLKKVKGVGFNFPINN